MGTETWLLLEQGKSLNYNWHCGYYLLQNQDIFFVAKEIKKGRDVVQYTIYLETKTLFSFSLETKVLISEIEKWLPHYTNTYDWGFGFNINELWELFEMIETMKKALFALYTVYGKEKK